jgi:hypothetical protein
MQSKNRSTRDFKFPQQLIPLSILFVIGIAALVVVRHFLVPPTFGEYGHYRAASIEDNMARPTVYAGYTVCGDCHDDILALKSHSNHRGVACEVCHGPGGKHVEDPSAFPLEAPRQRGLCPLCHGYDPARPTGFPQIIPAMHNTGQACITCHNPHDPTLPHAPGECSACHRNISNQKAVSHHASLNCTTCHKVPQDHWVNPLTIIAQKPTDRALCGTCHAEDADSPKTIPRVAMETHGGRYLCWDCHYPHSPEAY